MCDSEKQCDMRHVITVIDQALIPETPAGKVQHTELPGNYIEDMAHAIRHHDDSLGAGISGTLAAAGITLVVGLLLLSTLAGEVRVSRCHRIVIRVAERNNVVSSPKIPSSPRPIQRLHPWRDQRWHPLTRLGIPLLNRTPLGHQHAC